MLTAICLLESVLTFGLDLPIKVLWWLLHALKEDPKILREDPKMLCEVPIVYHDKNHDPLENWGFGMRIRKAKKYGRGQLNMLYSNGKKNSVLRIRDVYPGSEFFPSRIRFFSIRDPGSASKNLSIYSILTKKNGF
jgi:hypothetical protein